MTFTLTPINMKDASATTQPMVSYNDGTNNTVAHCLVDSTGALIAPATSAKQDTGNTSLATIATAVQAAIPAGTNIIGRVTTDQTTHGTTDLVAADITKVAGGTIAQGHGTAATALRVELPTDGTGVVGLIAGSAKIGVVTTDQTTHGTTDLVAADVTKIAGSAIAQGHGTAASAVRVELPTDGTGVVGLIAGSNIVGKVGIDQTTPGTTNGVQVNAALPAGTNSIGTVVVPAAPVPTIVSSSAYAHTAVTTAYVSGQLWANNATAGSVTFGTISVAKANNQAFSIIGGVLKKSGTVLTNAIFRVHFFNAAPTTAVGDYGTFLANLTLANWIGKMDCTVDAGGSDCSYGILYPSVGSNISNIPVSGAQTVYFAIEVRAAYTPVSSETLTLTLTVQ